MGSPYDITVSQAALISVGLAFLMTMGFAGLTLLLSSRLRSMLAVFVIDAALVLVTGHDPHGRHRHSAAYPVPFPHVAFRTRSFLVLHVLSRRRLRDRRDRAIAMLYLSLVVVCVPLAAVSLQAASGGVATSAKQAETFCQRAARTRRAAPRNAHPARRHPAASAALPLPAPPSPQCSPSAPPPFDLLRHLTRPPHVAYRSPRNSTRQLIRRRESHRICRKKETDLPC